MAQKNNRKRKRKSAEYVNSSESSGSSFEDDDETVNPLYFYKPEKCASYYYCSMIEKGSRFSTVASSKQITVRNTDLINIRKLPTALVVLIQEDEAWDPRTKAILVQGVNRLTDNQKDDHIKLRDRPDTRLRDIALPLASMDVLLSENYATKLPSTKRARLSPAIKNELLQCFICAQDKLIYNFNITDCNQYLCTGCSRRLKTCPYCRGPIQQII